VALALISSSETRTGGILASAALAIGVNPASVKVMANNRIKLLFFMKYLKRKLQFFIANR
jgi:hypothetical protein